MINHIIAYSRSSESQFAIGNVWTFRRSTHKGQAAANNRNSISDLLDEVIIGGTLCAGRGIRARNTVGGAVNTNIPL